MKLKQLSTEERFDVFLCYRDEGVDRAVAERLKDKLTCCHIETECSNRGGHCGSNLRVFLKAEPSPPDHLFKAFRWQRQCTTAPSSLCYFRAALSLGWTNYSKILKWIIDWFKCSWQHEMALELFESGVALHSRRQKLVPLLIGSRSEQSGSAVR